MPQLLWDASALVKRYLIESGSDTVDALWAAPDATEMVTTYLGHLETAAILRRRRNAGAMKDATFHGARSLLRQEVLNGTGFRLLTADADIPDALALVDRHNINASDAVILAAFLRFSQNGAGGCALVSADKRLLRAAAAEGLNVLDPEEIAAADVPAFLASL